MFNFEEFKKNNPVIKLNVGSGKIPLQGWINLDCMAHPTVDVVHDLNAKDGIPLPENSVDVFLISHVLEHIPNTLLVMEKLYKLAKPEAKITIACPYAFSDASIEDQTHIRFFVENSCCFFSQPVYCNNDYGYRGDWQIDRVVISVLKSDAGDDSDAVLKKRIKRERNLGQNITYFGRAIKPFRPQLAELVRVPSIEIERI